MKRDEKKIQETLEELYKQNPDGLILIFIHKGTSRSGMTRRYDVYQIKNNELLFINYIINNFGYSQNKDGEVILKGCGLDVVYHCVQSINNLSNKYLNFKIITKYYLL